MTRKEMITKMGKVFGVDSHEYKQFKAFAECKHVWYLADVQRVYNLYMIGKEG